MSIREAAAQALAEQRAAARATEEAEKLQRIASSAALARKWLSDRGVTPDSVEGVPSKYSLPSFVVEGIPMKLVNWASRSDRPAHYVAQIDWYTQPEGYTHYTHESATWYDLPSLGRALEQLDHAQQKNGFIFALPKKARVA